MAGHVRTLAEMMINRRDRAHPLARRVRPALMSRSTHQYINAISLHCPAGPGSAAADIACR
jgi:hypothetical protein